MSATPIVCQVSPKPAVSSARWKRSCEREKVVQKPPYSLSSTFTMPVKPGSASSAPYSPLCEARPACMRFTIAPYCAAISPAACVPAMPSACTVFAGVEPQAARRAGRGREHAERRARVPALADVLRPHAQADARADFVAGDRGGEEFAAAHAAAQFGDREQRRQHHRAHVQHALAVHVVELEALHLRAVDERRVRRRQPPRRAPHRA